MISNTRFSAWLDQHKRSLHSAVNDLLRRPIASLMTLLVIAVALALPSTLLALLQVSDNLTADWSNERSITLFLKSGIEDEKALILSSSIESLADVVSTDLLTSADALAEFRLYSGFGETLDALATNPLPNLILVKPVDTITDESLETLINKLTKLPESDIVEYDQLWIQRLNAITAAGKRLALAFGIALAIAVVMIIGNTIRLEIANRHDEIEISRLVGGTNGFIRRPFLYTGLLYGLTGAFFAWLLVSMFLLTLHQPVNQLEQLYSAQLDLHAFDFFRLMLLIPTGLALGLSGAWTAVSRQLSTIQPS